jgi:hypothetical protein
LRWPTEEKKKDHFNYNATALLGDAEKRPDLSQLSTSTTGMYRIIWQTALPGTSSPLPESSSFPSDHHGCRPEGLLAPARRCSQHRRQAGTGGAEAPATLSRLVRSIHPTPTLPANYPLVQAAFAARPVRRAQVHSTVVRASYEVEKKVGCLLQWPWNTGWWAAAACSPCANSPLPAAARVRTPCAQLPAPVLVMFSSKQASGSVAGRGRQLGVPHLLQAAEGRRDCVTVARHPSVCGCASICAMQSLHATTALVPQEGSTTQQLFTG